MKIKIYYIVIAVLIAIFFLRECKHQGNTDRLISSISEYQDSVKYYKTETGNLVAHNSVLELENQNQMESLLQKDKEFKELSDKFNSIDASGEVDQETIIIKDTLELIDSIPCDFKPIQINKVTPHYSIFATIEPSLLTIDTMKMFNTIKYIVGEKKIGLFKKEKRIEIINSNPYIRTTNATTYTISDKKKWYQTKAFAFGCGVISGALLIKLAN